MPADLGISFMIEYVLEHSDAQWPSNSADGSHASPGR